MFQSFTGSSRKPRQVNLSGGRRTGESAVLFAQQEREKRQFERDRLATAKLLQRLWRGQSTRKKIRQEWRDQWDAKEKAGGQGVYSSQAEALEQLQRLLHFIKLEDGRDFERLQRLVERLRLTLQSQDIICAGGPWPKTYLRLQKLVLTAIPSAAEHLLFDLDTLDFIAEQIPEFCVVHAKLLYHNLAGVVRTAYAHGQLDDQLLRILVRILTTPLLSESPLQSLSAASLDAYAAFALEFLTLTEITQSPFYAKWFDTLAEHVNHKLLARALPSVVHFHQFKDTKSRVNLLASFIYFHRHAHQFQNAQAYSSHKDFAFVVSHLLSSLADDVNLDSAQQFDADENDTDATKSARDSFVGSFAQEQISSLVNQESIGSLLWGASDASTPLGSSPTLNEEAKQLANYALTLLRFFPRRGDEIRMWLYLGSTSSSSPTKSGDRMTAIKFFWQATKSCAVFNAISRDISSAIHLLNHQAENGGKGTSLTAASRVQDDWRVILVFLELYTFVLKLMDDEEFLSSCPGGSSASLAGSSWARHNALPLNDVKDLTIFLKNLGFTMYFRANDILAKEDSESDGKGLSSYFKVSSLDRFENSNASSINNPAEAGIAGLAGISVDYVKGLVTGLLRMVHEKDSRRKFLPKGHWLMTDLFDMTNFIPEVVAEEGNRHMIQEEDDEDVDGDNQDLLNNSDRQLIGTGRDHRIRYQEILERQQRKASRKRYMQTVAPRSEILQNMPFFIPFVTRVKIFREFVRRDQYKRRNGLVDSELWRVNMMNTFDHAGHNNLARHTGTIRRGHEFMDAYVQFYNLKDGLKEPIQITFMDRFGSREAGIDGGGVTKEFLTSVTSQAFSPSKEIPKRNPTEPFRPLDELILFSENEQHLLFPNPVAVEEYEEILKREHIRKSDAIHRTFMNEMLQQYEFLGRIIGKCLYEGILVDINFAGFFLLKWALTGGSNSAPRESGYRANLNDLRDLDEELFKGLIQLKNYPGDVEDFALNFTVSDTIRTDMATGATKTITKELKPGGGNIPVTNENRLVYISFIARHRLSAQPYRQTMAFLEGLHSMINASWLSMFNQSELQTLIGGTSSSIDVADLRRNTEYGGVYSIGDDGLEHSTIVFFWEVFEEMDDRERRLVLKFVTSTPRAPLLGFGSLTPRFSIRDSSDDETRLPSTSTCVNLLKLPRYSSKAILKDKLLYAVSSGAGFDLS